MIAFRNRERSRGFTLLELLIAINLIAIVMAMVYSAIHTAGRSWDAVESEFDAGDQIRVANRFIRQRLAQARPLSFEDDEGRRIAFLGDQKAVQFVAPMPFQRGNAGGLYVFTFMFTEGAGGDRLEVSYSPYLPDVTELPEPDEDNTSVLVDDIGEGEIAYFGLDDNSPDKAWHERWERRDVLPELVRVRMTTPDPAAPFPELIVSMKGRRG